MSSKRKRKLSAVDYGGDGKVLVLLHGFLASSAYWHKLQPMLTAKGYRVITIDLLGFGHAPKPRHTAYDYEDHLAHVEEALDRLHVEHPFTLIGHSMGALLAARFAREHSDRVRSLILLHPPLFKSVGQAYQTIRDTGRYYRLLLESKLRAIAWGIARLVPAGKMTLRHTKQSRERSLRRVIFAAEGLEDLRQLETNTLLLIGTKDRKVYLDNFKSMPLNHNVTLAVESLAHHSPFTHPEQVFDIIHGFARDSSSGIASKA